jgi:hypothetical protein
VPAGRIRRTELASPNWLADRALHEQGAGVCARPSKIIRKFLLQNNIPGAERCSKGESLQL